MTKLHIIYLSLFTILTGCTTNNTCSLCQLPIDSITDSSRSRLGFLALNVVDSRARLLGADETLENQLDPYLFLKDAYENSRINSIYDGNPPVSDEDEFDF